MSLVHYGSSGEASDDSGKQSEDSYFVGSDDESVDSATLRRNEAEKKVRDSEELLPGGNELPDPLSALRQSRHIPSYLTPEATRPLAAPVHRGRPATPAQQPEPSSSVPSAPAPFDVARMAPPLKGQTDASKRGLPAGAVISAAPKRFRDEDTLDGGGAVTAAQIAMLGGQWRPSADEDPNEGRPATVGPALPPGVQDGKAAKKASKAMGVTEFIEKGIGGAQLPRKRQDRKDKEKSKRNLGQSAIGSWKTEAEMVLRQQYDS